MRLTLGTSSTLIVAAVATFLVTATVYGDVSHPTFVTGELLILLAAHALGYLRVWMSRELLLTLAFVGYVLLTLAWTDNGRLALTTMPSIVNFTIVLLFFSSMTAYHNLRALMLGMIGGYLLAAVRYTLISGFPFSYPDDFSYNAIAAMYLFGLFITAVYGAYRRRIVLPLITGAVLLLLIAATTSIKTNLGAALGIIGASILYFRPSVKRVVVGALMLAALSLGISYALSSNPALTEKLNNGLSRVSLGVAVLTNREGDSGTTGLGNRKGWEREGIKGWQATPVFGHGIEAFRADFGITSHSTPIDLLYNSGLIGTGLFYAIFASLAVRLLRARDADGRAVRARIAAFAIAWAFISLSAIIYYDSFLAMFMGVSAGLLVRLERSGYRVRASARSAPGVDGSVSSA
jgi:hypothetical protein